MNEELIVGQQVRVEWPDGGAHEGTVTDVKGWRIEVAVRGGYLNVDGRRVSIVILAQPGLASGRWRSIEVDEVKLHECPFCFALTVSPAQHADTHGRTK